MMEEDKTNNNREATKSETSIWDESKVGPEKKTL